MDFKISLIAFVLLVLSVGFASAHDPGNIAHDTTIMGNTSSSLENVALSSDSNNMDASNNDGAVQSNSTFGNWNDLCNDIQNLKPGTVYNLKHDYMKPDGSSAEGINIITDNVTINANGHTIYGNTNDIYDAKETIYNKGNIFTVTGNNVKINNLIISNAGYENVKEVGNNYAIINFSPICWIGNNGQYTNCLCRDNKAFNGGAITWLGNNGVIDKTIFSNCSSTRVGSAIYQAGQNLKIRNIEFYDLKDGWGNLPIYISSIMDVYKSPFYMTVFGENIDIVQCFFDSFVYGGMQTNNNITFYAETKDSDFYLNFAKETYDQKYNANIIQSETVDFKDVLHDNIKFPDFENNFFSKLRNGEFSCNFVFSVIYNVTDSASYNKAIRLNSKMLMPYMVDSYSQYKVNGETSTQYGVNRNTGLHVNILTDLNNAKTWHPNDMGFDVMYIDGHDHEINGNAGERQEYKFAVIDNKRDYSFMVYNLTVKKFNNAIVNNGGLCVLDSVTFDSNKMNYILHSNYGAAIKNAGMTICTNCNFINNKCDYGGAIFNQGVLNLVNCTFSNNKANKLNSKDVLNVDKGIVTVDGVQMPKSSTDLVKYKASLSDTWTKVIKYGSMGLSFTAGFIAGIATANPVVGAAVGAGVGLALGVGASVAIAKTNYNMYFNVAKSTAIIITGNIGAGILGGLTGGAIGQSMTVGKLASEYDALAQELIDEGISSNTAYQVVDGATNYYTNAIADAITSTIMTYASLCTASTVYACYFTVPIIDDIRDNAFYAAHVVAGDAAGDYNITAKYNGSMVSNKIKVLPILNTTDLTKKNGDSDKFVATLVDGQGKAYSKQKV